MAERRALAQWRELKLSKDSRQTHAQQHGERRAACTVLRRADGVPCCLSLTLLVHAISVASPPRVHMGRVCSRESASPGGATVDGTLRRPNNAQLVSADGGKTCKL